MSGIAFWENDQKLAEVRKLLDGPSIHVGTAAKPLAQRGLLDAAADEVLASPEQILGAMVRAFEAARDAVVAVKHAWAALEPEVERLEKDIIELGSLAEGVGEKDTVGAELDTLDGLLGVAREKIAKDPLGASGSVQSDLGPRIAAVRAKLGAIRIQKEHVERGLAEATELRRALDEAQARAHADRASAVAAFARAHLPDPVARELVLGLDPWREKIERAVAAHRYSSAAVGIERWRATCEEYLAADRGVVDAAAALRDRRSELAGRFSARSAQLQALAAKGSPRDPELEALAIAARSAIEHKPWSLDAIARTVDAFEAAVIAAAKRK
jgi:hypothetical protein